MDRIWSKFNNLDTFVHRKLQIYNWMPTSIKPSEKGRLRNSSTQLQNFKPPSAYKAAQLQQLKKIRAPLSSMYLQIRISEDKQIMMALRRLRSEGTREGPDSERQLIQESHDS